MIKIKKTGVIGRAVIEIPVAEGQIEEIHPLPDDLGEVGEIDLNVKGKIKTFFITSSTKIELV